MCRFECNIRRKRFFPPSMKNGSILKPDHSIPTHHHPPPQTFSISGHSMFYTFKDLFYVVQNCLCSNNVLGRIRHTIGMLRRFKQTITEDLQFSHLLQSCNLAINLPQVDDDPRNWSLAFCKARKRSKRFIDLSKRTPAVVVLRKNSCHHSMET